MPFDAFTGDTIHQYFQMYQQIDCAIDARARDARQPDRLPARPAVGGHDDLQHAARQHAARHRADDGVSSTCSSGDAPFFKSLADNYTMSDNYHQPVMGGTGPDSQPLGFADQVFYSDGNGHPATPPAANIYNPDPQAGTLNLYTKRAQWFNCSDRNAPGIAAIANYLDALPYHVSTNCGPGEYLQAVNVDPAFTPKGLPGSGLVVPPTTQRSIGDVLTAHNVSWKYYGGGFNADGTASPFNGSYCNICNPFEYQAGYPGDGAGPHARRDGPLRRS